MEIEKGLKIAKLSCVGFFIFMIGLGIGLVIPQETNCFCNPCKQTTKEIVKTEYISNCTEPSIENSIQKCLDLKKSTEVLEKAYTNDEVR